MEAKCREKAQLHQLATEQAKIATAAEVRSVTVQNRGYTVSGALKSEILQYCNVSSPFSELYS